ncbi:MAG: helix-turn-helix transcriptional regulator [Desulfobacteraceae bacterium]|nr:helix-turn-helix transcriptional regulator [Desulfobacteraceae bacterium]
MRQKRDEKTPTPFSAALKYMLDEIEGMTQTKLADGVGVRQTYISALKKANRHGSKTLQRKIALFFNYEYEEFLAFGEELISKIVPLKPEPLDAFKGFKDSATAKELVSCLVVLEDMAIDEYYAFFGTIKGRIMKLKQKGADFQNSEVRKNGTMGGA